MTRSIPAFSIRKSLYKRAFSIRKSLYKQPFQYQEIPFQRAPLQNGVFQTSLLVLCFGGPDQSANRGLGLNRFKPRPAPKPKNKKNKKQKNNKKHVFRTYPPPHPKTKFVKHCFFVFLFFCFFVFLFFWVSFLVYFLVLGGSCASEVWEVSLKPVHTPMKQAKHPCMGSLADTSSHNTLTHEVKSYPLQRCMCETRRKKHRGSLTAKHRYIYIWP